MEGNNKLGIGHTAVKMSANGEYMSMAMSYRITGLTQTIMAYTGAQWDLDSLTSPSIHTASASVHPGPYFIGYIIAHVHPLSTVSSKSRTG